MPGAAASQKSFAFECMQPGREQLPTLDDSLGLAARYWLLHVHMNPHATPQNFDVMLTKEHFKSPVQCLDSTRKPCQG
jgi:hypothetical protein